MLTSSATKESLQKYEICNTRVHRDTYADKVSRNKKSLGGEITRGFYCTCATTDRLDIHESKSVPCGSLASGGLAGGEFTDSGGEGYEASITPSLGKTGTESG